MLNYTATILSETANAHEVTQVYRIDLEGVGDFTVYDGETEASATIKGIRTVTYRGATIAAVVRQVAAAL